MPRLKDPVSGLTHLGGALLSVVGLVVLVCLAARRGTPWHTVSFAIFGTSLMLLYTASSLYHLLVLGPRPTRVLRRLDHCMIFVLIAGTYTPVCLVPLRGPWGWSLLGSVWGLALAGVVLKLLWLEAPRWLSATIYVALGWLVVTASVPLFRALPTAALLWLLGGGLFYSTGAIIYATKWPRLAQGFGFHEVFHLFVLAGSLSHYWLALRYILPPA
ncbi:MAG: hemolysin III family protein [Bacillota bacterium]